MHTPFQVAEQYATVLSAAGIRATTDPRDVVPPCVLFTPADQVDIDRGCGGTAQMSALLLVRGPGQGDAWQTLEQFVAKVIELLPAEQIRSTSYSLDDSGSMPAYELSWTATVDWNTP